MCVNSMIVFYASVLSLFEVCSVCCSVGIAYCLCEYK